MASAYPDKLADCGYGFDEDGVLKEIDNETGKFTEFGYTFIDRIEYDKFWNVVTEHIYQLLEEKGLHKIYVCEDKAPEDSAFIFMNKENIDKSKKLLILINGYESSKAGTWSRNLVINESLKHGTQIPYIEKALELGYDVIVTNPNDNFREKDGLHFLIEGHSNPDAHLKSIMKKYVIPADPEFVAIVAHNFSGDNVIKLAQRFPNFFKDKVFAIALSDSIHFLDYDELENKDSIESFLTSVSRNWISSESPLNKLDEELILDIPSYSAGTDESESIPYTCMSVIFEFLEENYKTRNTSF